MWPGAAGSERIVVRLEQIGKRYGDGPPVLADLSLVIETGELAVLTGASGAGKTTLLNLLGLAEPPSQGRLALFGTDTASLGRAGRSAMRRRIGVVFQDQRLVDRLSVYDNVALPSRIAGSAEEQLDGDVTDLLAWLGLAERRDVPVGALSGGERQLAAVARAIAGRPELLLADEPAANVDSETALSLVQVFARLNSVGTTVLIATSDLDYAGRFSCRRLHLDRGRLAVAEALAAQ